MTRPVVIVGAGIGGLAAAAGLHRAGVPCVLVEAKAALGELGAGITLWPNALAALDAIGAGDAARRRGAALADASLRRPDGRWLRRIDRDALRARLGELPVCLPRPELVALLRDAADGVELRLGAECAGYTELGSGVAVRLAGGGEIDAAGLVGADGIHSTVAHQMQPDLVLRYAGYTNWRCIAEHRLGPEDIAQTWGHGQHFGCLPLRDGRTYWFATAWAPRRSRSPVHGSELDAVLARFGDWHRPIPGILAATDPASVLRHDILDRTPLRRWSSPRVAVIGDAAHPMRPHLAQGGGQAIEDGIVLARSIAAHGVPAGIARYAEVRRHRAERVVRESARLGRIIHVRARLGRAVRDGLGTALPARLVLSRMASHGAGRLLANDLHAIDTMAPHGGGRTHRPSQAATGGHA